LAALVLDASAHAALKFHADSAGITFMSSPFDEASVTLLGRLGVAAIKVASGEITNTPLLQRIAATGLPVIMSTGMSTFEEVDSAVDALGSARDRLALLHCVSNYPADPRDSNLLVMDAMRARYERPVGWSDHTDGVAVAIAAVALGANVVEKHITLSRDLAGPDHAASIEPQEFRSMTASIRTVEAALGQAVKRPSRAELAIAAVARKSLHWSRSLAPGDPVGREDLVALRPGTGISPASLESFMGRTVGVATVAGTPVRPADFEPPAGGSR
jgi:N,N'-diacetyllegionaminate synthase